MKEIVLTFSRNKAKRLKQDYPPEQLHNVIFMSACSEHIHYVRDEITSIVRTPVRIDLWR